jgi:hypothetical protein
MNLLGICRVRALAIEDQLSECQQNLRETLNIPGKFTFDENF